MKYEKYDTAGRLLQKGNFIGTKKLVREKVATSDFEGNYLKESKVKRYEPLKEGLGCIMMRVASKEY